MDRTERVQLRRLVADFERWGGLAAGVRDWHRAVRDEARNGERSLRSRSVEITRAGQAAWRVVPLKKSDRDVVRHLWERACLPTLTAGDRALLKLLTGDVPQAIVDVSPLLGLRRFFLSTAWRRSAEAAGELLRRQHTAVTGADGPRRLAGGLPRPTRRLLRHAHRTRSRHSGTRTPYTGIFQRRSSRPYATRRSGAST